MKKNTATLNPEIIYINILAYFQVFLYALFIWIYLYYKKIIFYTIKIFITAIYMGI